nr:probable plastidic glucose transporter 1 [Nicotiana tomentosiformis]
MQTTRNFNPMQRALAVHPFQCFYTPRFDPKPYFYNSPKINTQYPCPHSTSFSFSRELKITAANKQQPPDIINSENRDDENELLQEKVISAAANDEMDLGWLPAFPHVLTASMSNFLFGYHIG